MKKKGSLDHSTKLSTGSFLCQILRFFNFYFRNWFQTTIWKTMIPSHIIDHITTFNSFLFIPYIAILHENLYCFFYFSSTIWKSWKNYLLRQKKKSRTQFCTKWSETTSKWTTYNAVSFDVIWKHLGQKCVCDFFFDGFWNYANLDIVIIDKRKRLGPLFLVGLLTGVSWISMQKFMPIHFFIWPKMAKVWIMQLAACDQTRRARELIFDMDTNMTTINAYAKKKK